MRPTELPEDIASFVYNYFDSIEQIEVLLLLRSQPEKTWSTEEITRAFRSSHSSIKSRMQSLYQREVLKKIHPDSSLHSFSPASDEIAERITALNEFYSRAPARVIGFIYSQPPMAVRAFADAFRFRKDKK